MATKKQQSYKTKGGATVYHTTKAQAQAHGAKPKTGVRKGRIRRDPDASSAISFSSSAELSTSAGLTQDPPAPIKERLTSRGRKETDLSFDMGEYHVEKHIMTRRNTSSYAVISVINPTFGEDGRETTPQRVLTVPLNKDGSIKENAAIARLVTVLPEGSGTRKAHSVRNPFVDIGIDASTKHGLGDRAAFAWMLYPNESDIKGIDDSSADWWKFPPTQKPGAYGFTTPKQSAFVSIEGTNVEKSKVVAILNRNFTAAERKKMAGLSISVLPSAGRGVAGYYRQSRGGWENNVSFDEIVVAKAYLKDEAPDETGPNKGLTFRDGTLTHELIHYLRNRDDTREGMAARQSKTFVAGTDRDLEEAFTEAETAARTRTNAPKRTSGYYVYIAPSSFPKGVDPEKGNASVNAFIHDKAITRRLVDADGRITIDTEELRRVLMDEARKDKKFADDNLLSDLSPKEKERYIRSMFRAVKGKTAWKRVADNFDKTAISRLKNSGRSEVIDTYWQYKQKLDNKGGDMTISTHVYAPTASVSMGNAHAIARGGLAPGGELKQWHDGKLKPTK
jgi:hypothetical protein